MPMAFSQLLSDERQHGGVGEVEQEGAGGQHQQRPATEQLPIPWAAPSLSPQFSPSARSRPRALPLSMASAGMLKAAAVARAPKIGTSRNTVRSEIQVPIAPTVSAMAMLPAWSKAPLRPIRHASARRAMRPSVSAVTAGANTSLTTLTSQWLITTG